MTGFRSHNAKCHQARCQNEPFEMGDSAASTNRVAMTCGRLRFVPGVVANRRDRPKPGFQTKMPPQGWHFHLVEAASLTFPSECRAMPQFARNRFVAMPPKMPPSKWR